MDSIFLRIKRYFKYTSKSHNKTSLKNTKMKSLKGCLPKFIVKENEGIKILPSSSILIFFYQPLNWKIIFMLCIKRWEIHLNGKPFIFIPGVLLFSVLLLLLHFFLLQTLNNRMEKVLKKNKKNDDNGIKCMKLMLPCHSEMFNIIEFHQ